MAQNRPTRRYPEHRGLRDRESEEDRLDRERAEEEKRREEEIERLANEELKKLKLRRNILLFACAAVAAVCFIYLITYSIAGKRNEEQAGVLSEGLSGSNASSGMSAYLKNENAVENTEIQNSTGEVKAAEMLDEFTNLYAQNRSIVGWLKIDGTNIDYPVMQGTDNNYYLDHDFYGKSDRNGCLFLDTACSINPRSQNLIIYGHHMSSGKMFGSLENYKEASFCEQHPTFRFDSLYDKGLYQVMFVFNATVLAKEDVSFKYYQFTGATSAAEFDSNMAEMQKMELYDTGVRAAFGDRLVTLSTCDRSTAGGAYGRFVVVGKQIK
ncbi:MAG: class B sortase [Lachnospiraceae bacterium]|nr:class B sortase [Lachnospiraceae bacterium]